MSQKPINAAIVGWLSSLGLKQNGQNPVELADGVQPTIDISPFYQIGNEETITFNGATSTNTIFPNAFSDLGANCTMIPQGEVWALRGLACSISTSGAALSDIEVVTGIFTATNYFYPIGDRAKLVGETTSTRSYNVIAGCLLPTPIFIRGNNDWKVGFRLAYEEPAAISLNYTMQIKFRRFGI